MQILDYFTARWSLIFIVILLCLKEEGLFITRPENNLVGNCTNVAQRSYAMQTYFEFSLYLQINLSFDIKVSNQSLPRSIRTNSNCVSSSDSWKWTNDNSSLEEGNNSKNNNVKFNFTGETLFPLFLPFFFPLSKLWRASRKKLSFALIPRANREFLLLPVEETADNALKSQGVLFYFPSDGWRIIINADVSSVMLGNNHAEILFRANNTLWIRFRA